MSNDARVILIGIVGFTTLSLADRGDLAADNVGGLSMILSVVVTDWLHAGARPFWARRVGRSRWRRANLPVGAAIALAAAITFPQAGRELIAAAAGLAFGPLMWRYLDPLAPLDRRRGYVHPRS